MLSFSSKLRQNYSNFYFIPTLFYQFALAHSVLCTLFGHTNIVLFDRPSEQWKEECCSNSTTQHKCRILFIFCFFLILLSIFTTDYDTEVWLYIAQFPCSIPQFTHTLTTTRTLRWSQCIRGIFAILHLDASRLFTFLWAQVTKVVYVINSTHTSVRRRFPLFLQRLPIELLRQHKRNIKFKNKKI